MKTWLAVNKDTDEVDWGTVEYDLREKPEDDDEEFSLIEEWEWKSFNIVPTNEVENGYCEYCGSAHICIVCGHDPSKETKKV